MPIFRVFKVVIGRLMWFIKGNIKWVGLEVSIIIV
jgi:hypothetical protein